MYRPRKQLFNIAYSYFYTFSQNKREKNESFATKGLKRLKVRFLHKFCTFFALQLL